MSPRQRVFSILTVASVFAFGSLGAPAASWIQAMRTAPKQVETARTVAAEPALALPILPVAF